MKRFFTWFSYQSLFTLIFLLISTMLSAQPLVTKDLPQYLLSDFSPGKIKMKKGNDIFLNINYNTASGKMVFIKSGRLYNLVNPESVDSIYVKNHVFVLNDTVFLDVVAEGKIVFFIQYMSAISIRDKPAMSGTTQVSASNYYSMNKSENVNINNKLSEGFTVKSSTLFWVRVNDKMIKFTNERQLLKIFSENADKIKLFIKESDLKISNRDDLIRIGKYCNEIMK